MRGPGWRCNRFLPSCPLVCDAVGEAEHVAAALGRGVVAKVTVPSNADELVIFQAVMAKHSAEGSWVVVEINGDDEADNLRAAIHAVWLKCTWSHHEHFRLWIAVPYVNESWWTTGRTMMALSPLQEWALTTGRFLLSCSAIFKTFCTSYVDEFKVRELISAVMDGQLYAVLHASAFVSLLAADDVVQLYREADREEIFMAICSKEHATEETVAFISRCRDSAGRSALDVAVAKDFVQASVALRDLGCRSETFDCELLLDPRYERMFNELLDPWKPLPFNAVKTVAVVARAGNTKVLKRLFECRVDNAFQALDYALIEACLASSWDTLHTMVDRMSVTGVNPFRTGTIAAAFLPSIMERCWLGDHYHETTQWVIEGLTRSVHEEALTVRLPVVVLQSLQHYPNLMAAALKVVDTDREPRPVPLMQFFAHFDPTNEVAVRLSRRAADVIMSEGGDTDLIIFDLCRDMILHAPRASTILASFLKRALECDAIALTRRINGKTLLMECIDMRPPALNVAVSLIQLAEEHHAKPQFVNQIDASGNNVLQRLVVDVCQTPPSDRDAVADAVKLLLSEGVDAVVRPPAFTTNLFSMLARVGLGRASFELLEAPGCPRPPSLVLSTTSVVQAEMTMRANQQKRLHTLDARIHATHIPLEDVSRVLSFLTVPEAVLAGLTSAAWWYASLTDTVWSHRLPPKALSDTTSPLNALEAARQKLRPRRH